MSYEKVKSLKIDNENQKVFITGASNNVRPLTYEKWESPSLTRIFRESGRRAVEIEILKAYEEGDFQGGTKKYTNALKVIRYVMAEEYSKFDWRISYEYGSDEQTAARELRDSQEFKDFLGKALDFKMPKDKFVITKKNFGMEIYGKVNKCSVSWKRTTDKATKFNFQKEAEDEIFYSYKDEWKVKQLTNRKV